MVNAIFFSGLNNFHITEFYYNLIINILNSTIFSFINTKQYASEKAQHSSKNQKE